MATFTYNIALGRVVELYNRVDTNSPAGCKLVIMAINRGTASDATMKDYDTFSTLLGDAQVAEVTNSGYARKTLIGTDLAAIAPDDTNDRFDLNLPTQTWTAVAIGTSWTDLVIGYDPLGTNVDTNIVPLTNHTFVAQPNGQAVIATMSLPIFRAA